jgi:PhnB protein
MTFHNYLVFSGEARAAMTRYHEIFGGRLDVMRMADMPGDAGASVPADQAELVMHAALTTDDGALLMASDSPFGPETPGGFSISVTLDDADEVTRVFDALAKDGKVTMPLGETFWSPHFGMCTDEFGVPWMVMVGQPA